ncbi:MAG TPA: dienelactone hydrolase family protein [Rhizomicrobium sp.]
MGQTVSIDGRDGGFGGYLATPASGAGPGIVVIQEIFGINAVMRQMCDRLAAQGFFALAPDLFWRLRPGIQLTDQTDAEWKEALDLMGRFDPDKGVEDIQSTIDHLRGLTGVTGKIGAVGYCLGGMLAFLTAARTDADACVGYYGVSLPKYLGEAANITRPLMLHIADEDGFSSKEAQAQTLAALRGKAICHVYPGVDHAFARPGGKNFNAEAAGLADARTDAFFRDHLT